MLSLPYNKKAEEAIQLIEKEASSDGLTDKMEEFLGVKK